MKNVSEKVLELLLATRARAHAPYSGHHVAAVVESDHGRLHVGANVETVHYKSVCAEAAAIAAMISAGDRHIQHLYILGPIPKPCPPCGDCRQRIIEFAGPETLVHLVDDNGRILRSDQPRTLLPDAFGPGDMQS